MMRFAIGCRFRRGFTLVELLVVIAIIAVLAGLTIPAINSTLRSLRLNDITNQVVGELNLARQTAISRQVPVEVRFYYLPSESAGSSSAPSEYRGVQSFLVLDTETKPLGRPKYFPAPVRISTDVSQSSLLDNAVTQELAGTNSIATYKTNYRYRSFYFRPSGELSVTTSDVYFTLLLSPDQNLASAGNFATVQVDRSTGRTHTYAPSP